MQDEGAFHLNICVQFDNDVAIRRPTGGTDFFAEYQTSKSTLSACGSVEVAAIIFLSPLSESVPFYYSHRTRLQAKSQPPVGNHSG
jgi:hypothetical protein